MLSNAYFLAKFRFDTAENEPAKNLQNFRQMHFRKMHFRKMHFRKMHFWKMPGLAPLHVRIHRKCQGWHRSISSFARVSASRLTRAAACAVLFYDKPLGNFRILGKHQRGKEEHSIVGLMADNNFDLSIIHVLWGHYPLFKAQQGCMPSFIHSDPIWRKTWDSKKSKDKCA